MDKIESYCQEVGNYWGRAHEEVVYQSSLAMEIGDCAVMEVPLALEYKGKPLLQKDRKTGAFVPIYIYPDVIVSDKYCIECKASDGGIVLKNLTQCMKYMRHLKISKGFVVNFCHNSKKKHVQFVEINRGIDMFACTGDCPDGKSRIVLNTQGQLV